jgi:hypothetical protein
MTGGKIAAVLFASVAVVLVAMVGAVRYMSPTDWARVVTSPRHLAATFVAYRQLLHMTSHPEQRILWNYQVALEAAPTGEIHVVYAPRIHIDAAREDRQYPGAHIDVSSGVEAHVFIESKTLKVRRAYLSD